MAVLNENQMKKLVGESFQVKQSSGKTNVVVGLKKTAKIFSETINVKPEQEFLEKVHSDHIIHLYEMIESPKMLVYETIQPLKDLEPFTSGSFDFMVTLIRHVVAGLRDTHSLGFTHGDVARGNIGMNSSQCLVLYDFEDIKESTDKGIFQDLEMFLEDLLIHYKSFERNITLLQTLKEKLDSHRTCIEIIRKNVFGKEVKRKDYSYSIGPGDFSEHLMEALVEIEEPFDELYTL